MPLLEKVSYPHYIGSRPQSASVQNLRELMILWLGTDVSLKEGLLRQNTSIGSWPWK